MYPEEILGRDFAVSLRGYDRDEVDAFLGAVAEAYRAVLDELDLLRRQPRPEPAPVAQEPPPAPVVDIDALDELGAHVAHVLRSAEEAAAAILAEAEAEAERRRNESDRLYATDRALAQLAAAARKQEELRARLQETSDEVQLALLALGDPVIVPQAGGTAVAGLPRE